MSEVKNKILVIDDDEMILTALSRLLERRDWDVTTANGPEPALAVLETELATGGGFEVVLCDYRMPGMVGSEVLARVAEMFPETARLLITANTDFETVQDAVNRGGVHRVLTKPWKPQELFTTLTEAAKLARLQRDNRELNEAVQRQNDLLRRMNERLDQMVHQRTTDLLEGLISALDYRDTETQWHSRRVSLYARRLGELIGLQEPELTVIEQGALLHDIGKIGVRDSVLLKPGKLTADEWQEMRLHVRIGYGILASIEFLHDAGLVVQQHHERFDGKGYLQALDGDGIVIGARIFAVVDTFDAMTSDRPYRKGLSPEIAYEEIQSCAGSQFDPAIAGTFVAEPASSWLGIRDEVQRFAGERERFLASVKLQESNVDTGPAVGLSES